MMVSGKVELTTVDEDQQEVIVDQPAAGEFFGFASMLEQTPHQTTALAREATVCIEIERNDIAARYSASRWRYWTCSRCWGVSFMLLNNWFEFGRPAILTR